jgi:hypothetical protein
MPEPASLIMVQFLTWVADRPRTYGDVMEAWRSTCPRLSVWEDAIIDGLVRIASGDIREVTLTTQGRAMLARHQHPSISATARAVSADRRSDPERGSLRSTHRR